MQKLTHLSLFSGIGGLDLAAEWAGFETVGQCEWADYPTKVLEKRWPDVARWRDINKFSGWDLGLQEGVCYNKICEANDKKLQVWKTLSEQMKRNSLDEYIKSAKIADMKCPYLQAWLKEAQGFVPENADTILCAEKMLQTQMAENGCSETGIRDGREESNKNINIEMLQLRLDGEEESLPEINMFAKNVEQTEIMSEDCFPTILNLGQYIQNCDMNYLMELLFVGSAMTNCTRRSAILDALSAGVPCQPASVAGKRRGTADDRWLWGEALRIIQETSPTWAVLENVGGLITLQDGMAFESVLSDLESKGYETQAFIIPACGVDAPHRRDRVAIVAYSAINHSNTRRAESEGQQRQAWATDGGGDVAGTDILENADSVRFSEQGILCEQPRGTESIGASEVMANADRQRKLQQERLVKDFGERIGNGSEAMADADNATTARFRKHSRKIYAEPESERFDLCGGERGRATESRLGGMADGVSYWLDEPYGVPRVATGIKNRVDRLKSLGNSVVRQQFFPIFQAIATIIKSED